MNKYKGIILFVIVLVSTISVILVNVDLNISRKEDNKILKEDKNEYMTRQHYIENSYIIYDKIAICPLDNKIVDKDTLAQIAESLLQFENIEISFCIGYISESYVGISARSIGTYNVETIMKQLNGGGHTTEAATQLKNINIESAVNMLINEIEKNR